MKKLIVRSILAGFVMGSPLMFAGQGKDQPADPTSKASSTASTTMVTKVLRKDAKKKCLEENPSLKGKDLKDCIRHKMSN